MAKVCLILFVIYVGNCLAAVSAGEIVRKADAIRNPEQSFIMKVQVNSSKSEPQIFEVYIKGKEKTFIRTLSPSRDRGRNMLMLEENMWAYIPNLKRAVRINLSQKLTGEAANGDISRMRWEGDYSATIEKENQENWTLFLSALKKGLTYEKIRTVIEKKTYRPVSAEYLTSAGKILKKAEFKEYKKLAGALRPSLIVITDAVRADRKSDIRILEMEVKTLEDSLFSLERMQSQ